MQYQVIQTFYVDPQTVNNTDQIFLSAVKLYFKQRPSANNNAAGNPAPGINIILCKTGTNNLPDINQIISGSNVRLEYSVINTSGDSNTPTIFGFNSLVPVRSGNFYGIAIHFDSPEYVLWEAQVGDPLTGTNIIYGGPAGRFTGAFYQMGNDGTLTAEVGTNLKFEVDAAQFTSNNMKVNLVDNEYEFLNIDGVSNTFILGELVYQDFGGSTNGALSSNVTSYGPGTINISSNSFVIQGTGTHFTNAITGFSSATGNYIVITDGTVGNTNVLPLNLISNDTIVQVSQTPTFTNSACFYRKTAVANVFNINYTNNTIILNRSSSNSSVQWSASSIRTLIFSGVGSGYNNSDYAVISGGGATLNATANITTNATGSIIRFNISNAGFGFTSNGTVAFFAANGSASNGTNANTTSVTGATLRGSLSQSYCNVAGFFDWQVGSFTPGIQMLLPDTTVVNTFVNFANAAHIVDATRKAEIQVNVLEHLNYDAYMLGRTTELNTANSNLANIDGKYVSAYIEVDLSVAGSNQALFYSPNIIDQKLNVMTYQVSINNSDFGEVGDTGNCLSKHISTSFTIANSGLAEALRTFVQQYRPLGSNVEIWARMHNYNDPDSFATKAWTPLVITFANGQISSSIDKEDFYSATYELPTCPPSLLTLPGTVTVATGNVQLVTTNDTSANVAAGNLVKVYNNLSGFANAVYFVSVVQAVNSSVITIGTAQTNTAVLGSGFLVDLIDPTFQNIVFKDPQNSSIATYYNSTMSPYTKYSSFAIKVLFLSINNYILPKLKMLRAIAVAS